MCLYKIIVRSHSKEQRKAERDSSQHLQGRVSIGFTQQLKTGKSSLEFKPPHNWNASQDPNVLFLQRLAAKRPTLLQPSGGNTMSLRLSHIQQDQWPPCKLWYEAMKLFFIIFFMIFVGCYVQLNRFSWPGHPWQRGQPRYIYIFLNILVIILVIKVINNEKRLLRHFSKVLLIIYQCNWLVPRPFLRKHNLLFIENILSDNIY